MHKEKSRIFRKCVYKSRNYRTKGNSQRSPCRRREENSDRLARRNRTPRSALYLLFALWLHFVRSYPRRLRGTTRTKYGTLLKNRQTPTLASNPGWRQYTARGKAVVTTMTMFQGPPACATE